MKLPMDVPGLPKLLNPLLRGGVLPRVGLGDLARVTRSWASTLAGDDAARDTALQPVPDFGNNPGKLAGWVYAPPGLRPGAPLVVVLHGCTQTAAGFDRGTGWSTLAERHGFALLLPEQQRANNHNLCFNWFEPQDVTRGSGEVQSIRNMVAATVAKLGTDRARVFVTGLSAGGAMTAAMLATYPELFAAGSIVAGLPYGSAAGTQEALGAMFHPATLDAAERGAAVRSASPARAAWPRVTIWHGTTDSTVKHGNADETAKQWCDIHGLAAHGTRDEVGGARRERWTGPDGKVRVEQLTIPGMGHGYPIAPDTAAGKGVGHAMAHILPCGLSAACYDAESWGILTN